jgi:hypothetical protein
LGTTQRKQREMIIWRKESVSHKEDTIYEYIYYIKKSLKIIIVFFTSVSGKLELLPRCERLCQHCTSNSIEDELHFTLECPLYQKQRKTILISFHTFRKLFFSAFFSKNLNLDLPVFTDCKINIYFFTIKE